RSLVFVTVAGSPWRKLDLSRVEIILIVMRIRKLLSLAVNRGIVVNDQRSAAKPRPPFGQ
ncbi:MAG TPA: hypothetical protein VGN39_07645, partial [Terriglobales bacterium]|nr:hypothetical protein [Terriglobales bacterium]